MYEEEEEEEEDEEDIEEDDEEEVRLLGADSVAPCMPAYSNL